MQAKHLAVLGSIAVASCGPSAGEVSERSTVDVVPEALALALVSGTPDKSRIFVGAGPTSLGTTLPPSDLTLLGGLIRDNGGTVVYEVTQPGDLALSSYGDRVEQEGWEPAPAYNPMLGGFQSSPRPPTAVWCNGRRWLRASSVPYADRELLRVRYYEVELEPTPCDQTQMRNFGMQLPTLQPPPDAEVSMKGGGNSGTTADTGASVVTSLSADEVFSHYADELEGAGWQEQATSSGDGLAFGRWSVDDFLGQPALGVLAVWPMPDADTYRAWFQVERVPQPDR